MHLGRTGLRLWIALICFLQIAQGQNFVAEEFQLEQGMRNPERLDHRLVPQQ